MLSTRLHTNFRVTFHPLELLEPLKVWNSSAVDPPLPQVAALSPYGFNNTTTEGECAFNAHANVNWILLLLTSLMPKRKDVDSNEF